MSNPAITKESLDFLKLLKKNNNREWFNTHKDKYTTSHENVITFADALIDAMNKHDKIETSSGKESLFRIYKDVRFSKDKTPYSPRWSGGLKRAGKNLRGGYYFHIEPGNSFAAGGFWGPEPGDIKRIRQDIEANYKSWKKMLASKSLIAAFGKLEGDQISSAPRGFAKDHPAIDLLRYKQYIFRHSFSDKEVCSPGFLLKLNDTFKKMRPFFNYMSEVLTTDINGVSTIE